MAPDWPAWFGLKLAHIITLADTWQAASQLASLQALLNEEILMSDAAMPDQNARLELLHEASRRQALLTLGALPVALTGISPAFGTDDRFLARSAASLTACWHLLKGSDLATVEHLIGGYLLPLEAAARVPSPSRQTAAMLAAQAHRICGIITLHRNQLRVREQHCKRALRYAEIACDPGSHASALISLASTYFYASDPVAAAAVYEQVFQHGTALPALQRSRVHAELAVVYGQLGREQESVRAVSQAEDLYPDRPALDPSYLYAEFTPGSLALERGLASIALAEQFPGRGYQKKAAGILARAADPRPGVPDRIRYEIVSHQASTAVFLGDRDAFETFMGQGLDGVTLLGSRQRLREMQATMVAARTRWPAGQRVRALEDGLQRAAVTEELA
jgi:tetratricopeptide (TPR) repeat protein